jgi:hypothetical protein
LKERFIHVRQNQARQAVVFFPENVFQKLFRFIFGNSNIKLSVRLDMAGFDGRVYIFFYHDAVDERSVWFFQVLDDIIFEDILAIRIS